MERAWRWFAAAFAIVMCVVAGLQTSIGNGVFADSLNWRLFFYIIPSIFYLAFAFGYLRVRDSATEAGRWLTLLLLIALMQSLVLWSRGWESGIVPRATLWFFLVTVLLVGFRGLAIAHGSPPSPAWFRRLRTVPMVLLSVGASLVVSSLFLQVTLTRNGSGGSPLPTGGRLLLRQVRWVTAEIGLTQDIDDLATGIPSVAFDVAGAVLYAVAVLAALATLVRLVRARFASTRLRSSRVLPVTGAATMLCALWAVSDIYWGWQFSLDRMRWAAWLGFACWTATLGFGLTAVLRIARASGGSKNLHNLMLFQVPLALFNFFMVPEYIYYSLGGGIFPVPLAGLGLLLLGLQMQSWGYAALLLGREAAPHHLTGQNRAIGHRGAIKAYLLAGVLFVLSSVLAIKAQEGFPSPASQSSDTPHYHLFSVVSLDSAIEKLNQYGAMGYRFLDQTVAEGGAYTVIMEKSSPGTYQYLYASGTLHKSKFEESLNANGARGFRYIQGSMGSAGPSVGGLLSSSIFSYPVCVGLMERVVGADDSYEYKTFSPITLGSLAKDLSNAAGAGFQPVEAGDPSLGRGNHFAIVERSSRKSPQSGSVASDYRFIGISQLKDRERKIAEHVAGGFRILFTGYGHSGLHSEQSAFFALLEKSKPETEIEGPPVGREYKFLDSLQEGIEDKNLAAFVQQLNGAAASGYRPLGTPISTTFHTDRWLKPHFKFSAVLERSDRRLEYRFATADDTTGLSRLLAELWKEGFRVARSGLLTNQSAIVERELASTESKTQ
jgi:hypothetical protein